MPINYFKIKMSGRIVAGLFMSFSLIACSTDKSEPAPIRSISESSNSRVESTSNADSSYTRPPQIVQANRPVTSNTTATTASNATRTTAVTATTGNIQYTRNYQDIPKGGYQGDSYTVKAGDTLYYIGWVTGNDYRALAEKNSIAEPYALSVGQVLDVSGGVAKTTSTSATGNVVKTTTTSSTTPVTSVASATTSIGAAASAGAGSTLNSAATSVSNSTTSATTTVATANTGTSTVGAIVWRWPTQGKVIDGFSDSTGGNKGIDIAGNKGQDVVAAAKGRVVYAGNALRGYGNLIIIKHDDDYLSAYAHNDTMLVNEQQDVQAGQKIATMGNTGTTSVRLHFEIRYKSKSMNPTNYLPKQ